MMKEAPTYKHFLIELKRYLKNTVKKDYEPSPSPPFVIGGADIAAVAMAAGKTPELHSVTQNMPYLPENNRNETGDNLLKKDDSTGKTKSPRDNQYGTYGKIYDNYKIKMYGVGSRLQQIYIDSIEKLAKLKVLYGGKVRDAIKSSSYNPFRKTGLETIVKSVLLKAERSPRTYLAAVKSEYRLEKPDYKMPKNLEERLAA